MALGDDDDGRVITDFVLLILWFCCGSFSFCQALLLLPQLPNQNIATEPGPRSSSESRLPSQGLGTRELTADRIKLIPFSTLL